MEDVGNGARIFIARNTDGGILGGFDSVPDAERFTAHWERRHEQSQLVGNVGVTIEEIGAME